MGRLWKKDTSIGDRISVSGTHTVHGYRSHHLQLDGRIGEQYFVDGTAGDDYIDLFNTYLFVEAQIVNTDGSNLEPDTDVGPVDFWMHSLFSDVSVSLSEKLVSPPTGMYPYRAYIEILLSYGPAAKECQLTGVMWYKDTPGQQDKKTTDNKGFTARKQLTALSKSVQMIGKLHLDLFCQDKYLLNHVKLKIKLRRSRTLLLSWQTRPIIKSRSRKWLCI